MSYQEAKRIYENIEVDTDEAIKRIDKIPISLHCWQGDDVKGFVNNQSLSGGIQTTGDYPGRARNFDEMKQDLDLVLSLLPGTKRLALHAMYAISDKPIEMDNLTIKEFEPWLEWAKEKNIKLDFNPTLFSSDKVKNNFTLASNDKKTRNYWIKHVKCCREIANEIGKRQGSPCLNNIWIADGLKNTPADRLGPRALLKKSLDEIFSISYPKNYLIDSVESKLFGIGLESYTVGNSEFYQNYAATNKICCLLDNGHFHPTEMVSDKISSMLLFHDKIALHVTRGIRWDSDHVVLLEDEVKEIAKEIIRNEADNRILIGLDYFDASINRIVAWLIGYQAMRKALLIAALDPYEKLKRFQSDNNFTELMYYTEQLKMYPYGEVWNEYLKRSNIPENCLEIIKKYEDEVLIKRK